MIEGKAVDSVILFTILQIISACRIAAQRLNVQLQDGDFCAILELKPRDGLLGNLRFINMVVAAL